MIVARSIVRFIHKDIKRKRSKQAYSLIFARVMLLRKVNYLSTKLSQPVLYCSGGSHVTANYHTYSELFARPTRQHAALPK